MSRFNLAKKLQPARKAWKSFKTHLQPKLHHPKFAKAITTLRQRFKVAYRSIFPFVHRKFLALTKRSPPHHLHHHHHHFRWSSSAIYVDELFPGPVQLVQPRITEENMAESSQKPGPEKIIQSQQVDKEGAKVIGKGKAEAGESSKSRAPADKWSIPLAPQFRGIDERAEEFIAKVRQDMKLEREQSILEFEEMLKRSA
ncbi:hypothetical protein CDL12_24152 [Handroanthus impetiginosus]|uniref:Uncharacterized protein n=1 Tax=Handroanthus impetiginosus TaxID=429701 RepID=A0A2G9GDP6_9LAMI|nr:hypothetical protein CDL12_24152 [Handroanthus impetiginosus]